MELSKYDILSYAKISYKVSFRCNKENLEHFSDYDFEDINGVISIKTDLMPYSTAKSYIAKLFMNIKNYGKTSWDSVLDVNIFFPENISKIYQINALKLVLSTNEIILYNNFPDRKNRIGSRSVYEIVKPGANADSVRRLLCSNVYGIDLSRISENIITYSYIGGVGYETKFDIVSALIDKWILNIYSVVENPAYTPDEISKLSELMKSKTNLDDVFVSFKTFKDKYSGAILLVDLKPLDGQENVFWGIIKDRLYEVIKSLHMADNAKIYINYDTDEGRMQIKDTKLYAVSGLHDADLIDCTLSGDASRLSCYGCHITNSSLEFCDLFNGCDVMKSNISNCYISDGATVVDSIIDGDSTISGECSKCNITSQVKYTKFSKIKDSHNEGIEI